MRQVAELKSDDARVVIIIMGAGGYGAWAHTYCARKFPGKEIYFCDNDENKQGTEFRGCKVLSPEKSVELFSGALYIVANMRHAEEMGRQLTELGLKEEQIFEFRREYYLDPVKEDMWEISRAGYYLWTGKWIHKESLETFTEKMQYAKIYLADERKSKLTDKYLVRQYVKEKLGEAYLVPLLGVYQSFDEIDFNLLPNSFVLKTNHGCEMNHIIRNKKQMDVERMREDFRNWLNQDYSKSLYELHYHDIKPCILAEKFIEAFAEGQTVDYKFFCFEGKVRMIMVVKNIHQGNAARCFYDADYHFIHCELNDGVPMPEIPFEKPECFAQMIKAAEVLSEGIDQVRVDLYASNDKIFFGEMTFTSWSGLVNMQPEEVDRKLGSYWKMECWMPVNAGGEVIK